MNKPYQLKRFGTQENDRMIELDKRRRAKIENKTGKMTDGQWLQYKMMKNINRSKF